MGFIIEYILLILYILNFLSVLVIVFISRKSTESMYAWIFVFMVLPYVGFLFYYLLGSRRKIRKYADKYEFDDINNNYNKVILELHSNNIKEVKKANLDIINLNFNNDSSLYSTNNNIKLYNTAKDKFDDLLKDLEKATSTIHIMYFIIKPTSDIGKKIMDVLIRKQRSGIQVKLIYDKFGCLKTKQDSFKELIDAGALVLAFLPSTFRSLLQVNYRMHRKLVIIDGLIGYMGGINIGDEYLGHHKTITPWRDTAIKLTGDSVTMMQARFLSDWYFLEKQVKKKVNIKKIENISAKELFPDATTTGNIGVQILSSGPNNEYSIIKDSYLKMINKANKYLYIHTPYFVPDESILDSLRCAALSGVDVRIILPGIPDKKYVKKVACFYIEELLKWGIKVYDYKGFIHSKMFIIDDQVTSIGSANLDIRSFLLDYETNAFIYDNKFAKTCKKEFLKDIENSVEYDLEIYKKRSIWNKFLEALAVLIAPLT